MSCHEAELAIACRNTDTVNHTLEEIFVRGNYKEVDLVRYVVCHIKRLSCFLISLDYVVKVALHEEALLRNVVQRS